MKRTCVVLGVVLIGTGAVSALGGDVRYDITVTTNWSEQTHPGTYPTNSGAHLSLMSFLAHNDQISVWELGGLASPTVKQMAETGDLIKYQDDAVDYIADGDAAWSWWNFHTGPTESWTVTLQTVNDAHPLLTIMSMIGPSPDWFVGVSALDLREDGIWRNKVVVDMYTYDAGTRSAVQFELFGPLEHPPKPISLLDNVLLPGHIPIGSFTFELATAFLDGDLDHDGFVGINDLNRVLAHWNEAVPAGNQVRGDTNGDGFVGIDDLNVVLGNWNSGTPPVEMGTDIPEPVTGTIVAMGISLFSLRRTRRA